MSSAARRRHSSIASSAVRTGRATVGGALVVQSLGWYRNRLLSMSSGEIAWRISNIVRDRVDQVLLPTRRRQLAMVAAERSDAGGALDPVLIDAGHAARHDGAPAGALARDVQDIMLHRVRLFGARPVDVGTPIRWNYEHNQRIETPTGYAGNIDYRDLAVTGDCKWVWELNRHHHLVTLGRAYRVSGDPVYADELLAQIEAWMDACPFGMGMNWRSPLELAIRVINWTAALELIAGAPGIDAGFRQRIDASVYQHLWDIARKYSRYSSANNHLIGEAAGVYIASCAFDHLPGAARLRTRARALLIREMEEQVTADGVHRELATGYHLFVLQFLTLAFIAGSRRGEVFPEAYSTRLAAMFDFLAALEAGGAPMPKFGDCDDGYVLDLGGGRGEAVPWLNVGARLFDRPDWERHGPGNHEAADWLLGNGADKARPVAKTMKASRNAAQPPMASRCFPDAGIYLLQSGAPDGVSVTIDCGPLGFKSIAAHGHADALSVTLRAFGVAFLIDPGTYDYFTHPLWRDYFRSTRAHNTVEIDGRDQSEMLGKFLWGSRAAARCTGWSPSGPMPTFSGEHDGYRRLNDPVTHRRTVELDLAHSAVRIRDGLHSTGDHRASLYFHFAPEVMVEPAGAQTLRASRPEGSVLLSMPAGARIELVRGWTDPILGWASAGYHEKQPITTVRATCEFQGTATLETSVQISRTESDA